MEIKLRQFSLSDREKIKEIQKISFNYSFSEKYLKKLHQKHPQGMIVAENDKEIVGYVIFRPKNNQGKMISLAINPDFRGKNIGTRLAEFAIDHFRNIGIKKIVAHVRESNNPGLIFHQKLGFKQAGIKEKYYSNGDNAFLMIKEI